MKTEAEILIHSFEVARLGEQVARDNLSDWSRRLDSAERRVIAFLKANRLTEARDGDTVYRAVEDASGPRVQARDIPDVRHLPDPIIPPESAPGAAEYGPEAYAKSDPDCDECGGSGSAPRGSQCECVARSRRALLADAERRRKARRGPSLTIDPRLGF